MNLNVDGRQKLAKFLAEHLNDRALTSMLLAWENSVDFAFDGRTAHLEINPQYAVDHRPHTLAFDASEIDRRD